MENRQLKSQGTFGLVLLGGAWGLTLLVLAWSLSAAEFLLTFGTLVLAECLSLILIRVRLMAALKGNRQDALAHALIGWVGLCIVTLALYQSGLLVLFTGQPLAVLALLGLTLILSLLGFASERGCATTSQSALRLLIWVGCWQAIDFADVLSKLLALGTALFITLCLLFAGMIRVQRRLLPITPPSPQPVTTTNWALYADILLLPLVLSGGDALIYLLARGCAQVLITAIAHIGNQAAPSLTAIGAARDAAQFNAMAARLNLGLLLVGGGLGVVLLTAGDYIPDALGFELGGFSSVLGWLILAAAAPAFFGATDTLMNATYLQRHSMLIQIAAVVALCVATLSGPMSALTFAQTYAAVCLCQALFAAVLLARRVGVWPGLTAVLLRQIKLL